MLVNASQGVELLDHCEAPQKKTGAMRTPVVDSITVTWLVGRLVGRCVCWLLVRMAVWLNGCLVEWLGRWLVGSYGWRI